MTDLCSLGLISDAESVNVTSVTKVKVKHTVKWKGYYISYEHDSLHFDSVYIFVTLVSY